MVVELAGFVQASMQTAHEKRPQPMSRPEHQLPSRLGPGERERGRTLLVVGLFSPAQALTLLLRTLLPRVVAPVAYMPGVAVRVETEARAVELVGSLTKRASP